MKTIAQEEPLRRKQNRCRVFAVPLTVLFILIPLCHSQSDGTISVPLEVLIELDNGQPRLRWPSAPGQSYDVGLRTNLGQVGWTKAATVSAAGATTTWTDTAPLTASRFYRVAYLVPGIVAPVMFTHLTASNGIPDLATASFASVRDRLKQMAAAGAVALPVPMPDLAAFDSLSLASAVIHIDDLQRTVALSGGTTLRGQSCAVDVCWSLWGDDTNAATGFNLGVKFPQFQLTDWVSGLSGTVLDDLTLDSSVLTLATVPLNLNLSGFAGNAAGFYGGPTLEV